MFDKLKQSIKKVVGFLGSYDSGEEEKKDVKGSEENNKKDDNRLKHKIEGKKSKQSKDKSREQKTDKKKKENKKEKHFEEKVKGVESETLSKINDSDLIDTPSSQELRKSSFSEKQFENLFEEFELMLLESNVALEAIERLKEEMKKALMNKRGNVKKIFEETLIETIYEIINIPAFDIFELVKKFKPLKILFMGVNGSGKTTTLAKVAKMFLDRGYKVVFAAADTFRAASIEQLQKHANALGIKLIAHQYGSDPAAVAYDALQYAKNHNIDVVLIDSAGRLHTNVNLMKEIEKIKRVIKPEITFLVVDALTGNDTIDQAIEFSKVGFDGIILTKYDADDRGGTVISLCEITKKPIVFVGTGQGYDDIKPFNADEYLDEIFGGE